MKSLLLVLSFVIGAFPAFAQEDMKSDSTGLPGDHFSLEGALDLFKKSASPEAFEKSLNNEENHINNLDLNGDGEIDYVKVISKQEGDIHIFILQVPVSETEDQDIAVIELEKTYNEQARLQIIGDEDIYGEMVILEPSYEEKDAKPGTDISDVAVNVWYWRPVKIYIPWLQIMGFSMEMAAISYLVETMETYGMGCLASIQGSTSPSNCQNRKYTSCSPRSCYVQTFKSDFYYCSY
ncbi:MAG: hypothetical protein IPJ51_06365 [Saprospiraceae bacterium]|nr:hypothetical protein [Saprospiraceae bacterium]